TNICVIQNGVNLQSGNASAALDGLNTRFGLYGSSMPASCMASYPPDLNVRKGYQVGSGATAWCRGTPYGSSGGSGPTWPTGVSTSTESAKSLPLDSCFANGSCSPGNLGNGVWDCASYWTASHPGRTAPAGCTSTATISRYSVYQYEISNSYLADANTTTGETGTPQCSPS